MPEGSRRLAALRPEPIVERFGEGLLPSHRRAMDDLVHCRTETLGGHLLAVRALWPGTLPLPLLPPSQLPHTATVRTPRRGWQSAGRNACRSPTFTWSSPCPGRLGRSSVTPQQDLDDILLRAAAQALITLAADPHDVGALMGVLCVRHTWTRTLAYHPHVHCLVPAGGVSADRTEGRPRRDVRPGACPCPLGSFFAACVSIWCVRNALI